MSSKNGFFDGGCKVDMNCLDDAAPKFVSSFSITSKLSLDEFALRGISAGGEAICWSFDGWVPGWVPGWVGCIGWGLA